MRFILILPALLLFSAVALSAPRSINGKSSNGDVITRATARGNLLQFACTSSLKQMALQSLEHLSNSPKGENLQRTRRNSSQWTKLSNVQVNNSIQHNRSVSSPRGEGQDEGIITAEKPWSLNPVETWQSLTNYLYRQPETESFFANPHLSNSPKGENLQRTRRNSSQWAKLSNVQVNNSIQHNRSVPSPRGEGQDEGIITAEKPWSLSPVETWQSVTIDLYRQFETDHFAGARDDASVIEGSKRTFSIKNVQKKYETQLSKNHIIYFNNLSYSLLHFVCLSLDEKIQPQFGHDRSLFAAAQSATCHRERSEAISSNLPVQQLETDHFAGTRDDASSNEVAQDASIQGSVTLANGVPVAYALVHFQSNTDAQYSFSLITDGNGQFDTTNIQTAIQNVANPNHPAFYTWPQGGSTHHIIFEVSVATNPADAVIALYDMQGKVVAQLPTQITNGVAHAYWNGAGCNTGLYIARMAHKSGKVLHNPNGITTEKTFSPGVVEKTGSVHKSLTGNYTVSISSTEASNMQFETTVESANIQNGLNVLDYFISPTAFEYVFDISSSNGSNASVSIEQNGSEVVSGVLDENGLLVTDRQFLEDSVGTFTFYAQKDGFNNFDSTFTGKWNGHAFNFMMEEVTPVDSVQYTIFGETGTDGVSYTLSRNGTVFVNGIATQQTGSDFENVIKRHPDQALDSLEILVEKDGTHPWDTVIGVQPGLNEIDFPSLQLVPDYVLNELISGSIYRPPEAIGNAIVIFEGININYTDRDTMINEENYEFNNIHIAVDGDGNAIPTQYKRTILPTDTTSTQMFKDYMDTVTITQSDTYLPYVTVQQLDQNVTLKGIARAFDRDTLAGNKIIENRSLETMYTVSGVTVRFVTPDTTYQTITDANGEYSIPNIPCGTLGTWEVGYTDTLSNPFFSNVGHTHLVKDEVIYPARDSVKAINWVMIYRAMSIPATENDPNYGNTQYASPAEISEMINKPNYGTNIEEALGRRMKINLGNLTSQQQETFKEAIKQRDSLFYGIPKSVNINNEQRPFEIVYEHIPIIEASSNYEPFTNPQTDSLGWNVYGGINETQIRGLPVTNYHQYSESSITGGEISVSFGNIQSTIKEIEMRTNYFNDVVSRSSVANLVPTYPNLKDRAIMSEVKDNNMTRWNTDNTGTWYSEYPIDKLEYVIP